MEMKMLPAVRSSEAVPLPVCPSKGVTSSGTPPPVMLQKVLFFMPKFDHPRIQIDVNMNGGCKSKVC
jgi:hypothetical protein